MNVGRRGEWNWLVCRVWMLSVCGESRCGESGQREVPAEVCGSDMARVGLFFRRMQTTNRQYNARYRQSSPQAGRRREQPGAGRRSGSTSRELRCTGSVRGRKSRRHRAPCQCRILALEAAVMMPLR